MQWKNSSNSIDQCTTMAQHCEYVCVGQLLNTSPPEPEQDVSTASLAGPLKVYIDPYTQKPKCCPVTMCTAAFSLTCASRVKGRTSQSIDMVCGRDRPDAGSQGVETHNTATYSHASLVSAAPAKPPAQKLFQPSSWPRRAARIPSWHTVKDKQAGCKGRPAAVSGAAVTRFGWKRLEIQEENSVGE